MTRVRLSLFGVCSAVLVGLGALSVSCASAPDPNTKTLILQPDYTTYKQYVDPYVQRRCGTLDCHGQPGRAYRLYGVNGLRPYDVGDAGDGEALTSGGAVGGPAVQEFEARANFESAIALEPEEMSRVVARQGKNPDTLLLLRKPRLLERHKGGAAMKSAFDQGYECLVAWLGVRVTRRTADGQDFESIPEGQRESLSAPAAQKCVEAASYL